MDFQKHVYVVIGLGRSGTSTITRSLQALGVSLGDKTTGSLNAKGSFEDHGVSRVINRRVLEVMHYSWRNMSLNDVAQVDHAELQELKQLAMNLLQERFASTDYFAFKAISTAKILPFWQETFAMIPASEHYIIALRNPLAAAYSYQRINGADIELSLLQWLMHMIPAIENTRHKNRLIVSFDSLLQHPRAELERMQRELQIPMLTGDDEKNEFVNEFLDTKLKHHDCSIHELKKHPSITIAPLVVEMYELLTRVSHDEIAFESAEFTSKWQAMREAFNTLHPLYSYIDVLLTQHKSLERDLRVVHKSWAWKLMYPLRLLDDALRSARKKSREKNKLLRVQGV